MKCPVCRAENGEEPNCRRCKADLSMCQAVLRRRSQAFALAGAAMLAGRSAEAVEHANETKRLKADAESERWLAMTSLMARDFPTAWASYQRWKLTGQG